MSKCKNCSREFKGHPNKQFCSSKGKDNCKDLYHNRRNPRGFKSERYDGDYWNEYVDPIHPFSSEGLGQDGYGGI